MDWQYVAYVPVGRTIAVGAEVLVLTVARDRLIEFEVNVALERKVSSFARGNFSIDSILEVSVSGLKSCLKGVDVILKSSIGVSAGGGFIRDTGCDGGDEALVIANCSSQLVQCVEEGWGAINEVSNLLVCIGFSIFKSFGNRARDVISTFEDIQATIKGKVFSFKGVKAGVMRSLKSSYLLVGVSFGVFEGFCDGTNYSVGAFQYVQASVKSIVSAGACRLLCVNFILQTGDSSGACASFRRDSRLAGRHFIVDSCLEGAIGGNAS